MPSLRMRLLLIGSLAVVLLSDVNAGKIKKLTETLLIQSPQAAFEKAVARKDFRLLTIPFCGNVTPGFSFLAYQGPRPEENNFGLYCDSLLGEEEYKALKRLEKWVEKYNSLMFNQINQSE